MVNYVDQGFIRNCIKCTSGGWGFRSFLVTIVRRTITDWYLPKLGFGLFAYSDQPPVIAVVIKWVRVSTCAWVKSTVGGTDIAFRFASTNDYIFTIRPGVREGECLAL